MKTDTKDAERIVTEGITKAYEQGIRDALESAVNATDRRTEAVARGLPADAANAVRMLGQAIAADIRSLSALVKS